MLLTKEEAHIRFVKHCHTSGLHPLTGATKEAGSRLLEILHGRNRKDVRDPGGNTTNCELLARDMGEALATIAFYFSDQSDVQPYIELPKFEYKDDEKVQLAFGNYRSLVNLFFKSAEATLRERQNDYAPQKYRLALRVSHHLDSASIASSTSHDNRLHLGTLRLSQPSTVETTSENGERTVEAKTLWSEDHLSMERSLELFSLGTSNSQSYNIAGLRPPGTTTGSYNVSH